MSELRAGVDRPGGSTARKPVDQRGVGDHRPPVFGESPRTRGIKPMSAIRRTVMPTGMVEPKPIPGEEKKPPLKIGDPVSLDPGVINFEQYGQQRQWREAGTVGGGDYILTAIHSFGHRAKPLYELTQEHPDRPTTHVYIRPIGHERGWVRVKRGS